MRRVGGQQVAQQGRTCPRNAKHEEGSLDRALEQLGAALEVGCRLQAVGQRLDEDFTGPLDERLRTFIAIDIGHEDSETFAKRLTVEALQPSPPPRLFDQLVYNQRHVTPI